jgi:Flp pilus assembly pilin Flp
MRKIRKNMAQSIVEYAVLLTVVSAAIVAMYLYVNRTVQARFKQIESEINEPVVIVSNVP